MTPLKIQSLFICCLLIIIFIIFSHYYLRHFAEKRRFLPISLQSKLPGHSTVNTMSNFREGMITWIDPLGSFMERLLPYNEALDALRTQLSQQSHLPWRDLNADITILDGIKDELLYTTNNTKLYTLALKRRNVSSEDGGYFCLKDTSNYLVQNFYMWSSTSPHCDYQKKLPDYTQLLLMYKCNENITRSQIPECLKPIDHYSAKVVRHNREPNSSFPRYFLNNYPEYIFYIHALHDGIVDADGYVFTDSVKIVDVGCLHDFSVSPPKNYGNSSLYPEVFVISQKWGKGYFHKLGEDIPRISPYTEFLAKNKDIKVHVKETELRSVTAETLKMLGIHPDRLIEGVIRAKIVYLPQATNCGYSNQHSVQLASRLYREYVDRNQNDNRRNLMVMIHRTAKRLLVNYDEKEREMRKVAEYYNLKFEVLSDDALPSFQEQVLLFRRAAVVIGSHGAGFVNMIYSDPGTLVIEGTGSPRMLGLCYVRLAHVLGHYYHAIPSLGKWRGTVNIKTDIFITEAKKVIHAHFKGDLKVENDR